MKRHLFAALCLMGAVSIQAQMTKVKVAYQPGDTVIYHCTEKQVIEQPMGGNIGIDKSYDERIVVKSKNDEGYILEVKIDDPKLDGGGVDDLEQLLENLSDAMCANVPVEVQTDADGKILSIVNKDAVVSQMLENMNRLFTNLENQKPEAKEVLQNARVNMVEKMLTSETIMRKMFFDEANPLALNGKTLMTGMIESHEKDLGLKYNNVYTVTDKGKTVKVNSKLSLTRDQLKAFVLEQVEKTAPQQLEMIKQNIDMVLDSGMMKLESNENSTYTFNDRGWVESIVTDEKQDAMGAKVSSSGEQKITYKNF